MSAIKDEAVVLRRRTYSESSLVLTLFTREHGRLDVLAKGARREKGPLFGHLDLYQREAVLVLPRPQAGLDLLTEASFVDEHAGLRFCPSAFAAAGVLAEVAVSAIQPADPQPDLYASFVQALAMLARLGEPEAKAGLAEASGFGVGEKNQLVGRTVQLALLDMLSWLGFGLELRRCVKCGREASAQGGDGLSRRGGLVCRNCRGAGDPAISPASLAELRRRDGAKLEMSPEERMRWLLFLLDYAQHALEKPLRGRKVLLQLLR